MKKILLISFLTLITHLTNAQTRGMKPVEATVPTGTERRMVLVVGNKDYAGLSKLLNPLNDAEDMKKALLKMGFEVIKATNADYRTFVGRSIFIAIVGDCPPTTPVEAPTGISYKIHSSSISAELPLSKSLQNVLSM